MREAVEKALDELGVGRGKAWNVGMPLPLGRTPWLNYGRKGRSGGGYPSSSRNYGKDWVGDFPVDEEEWDDIPRGRAVERIANDVLDVTQLRFVWFIFANHDEKYSYDEKGRRIPLVENGRRKWKTEKADNHITVRLGMDENTCMLHGHIYVAVDENNIPTGLMEEGTRKHITSGDDRILELWEYTLRPKPSQSEAMTQRKYHSRKAAAKRRYAPVAQSTQGPYHSRYPTKSYGQKGKRYNPRAHHCKNGHRQEYRGRKYEDRYSKGKRIHDLS